MQTKLLKADDAGIALACTLLRAGEVVGIPTETVYGLAGDALCPNASLRIYEAKGRPPDNPLIVHIADLGELERLTRSRPKLAYTLAEAFWPGPLTMIFPKSPLVPPETSGGLDTVALRMPSHPVALKLIRESGLVLAAPSANRSGYPSPSKAAHVLADMDGKIPLILDGGECAVGVESTVIAVGEDWVRLLRPGGVTKEMLSKFCKVEVDDGVLHKIEEGEKALSPGMKYKHYSPKAQVILVDGTQEGFSSFLAAHAAPGVGAMAYEGEEKDIPVPTFPFGRRGDGAGQAKRLFENLRECDEQGLQTVYVPMPDQEGVGLAVYNRLLRAAGFRSITLK